MQSLAKFISNMADVSSPLRQLLEKEIDWHWEKEREGSFQKLKLMASSTPVLGYYDPDKPVTASYKGLQSNNIHPRKVCANRKENPGHCLWCAEIPSIPLWQASYGPVRPQAT